MLFWGKMPLKIRILGRFGSEFAQFALSNFVQLWL